MSNIKSKIYFVRHSAGHAYISNQKDIFLKIKFISERFHDFCTLMHIYQLNIFYVIHFVCLSFNKVLRLCYLWMLLSFLEMILLLKETVFFSEMKCYMLEYGLIILYLLLLQNHIKKVSERFFLNHGKKTK